MNRTYLSMQAAIVLTMVSFVSWPELRPSRRQSVWRYAPAVVLQARTLDAARFSVPDATARLSDHAGSSENAARASDDAARSSDGAARIGADQLGILPDHLDQTVLNDSQANQTSGGPVAVDPLSPVVDPTSPVVPPIEIAALGGRVNALVGFARTSLNAPIPYARVVLRNIVTGEIVARAMANDQGRFLFLDLDANAYVVELLGPDGSVIAISPLVTLGRGDLRQTEIRAAASATTIAASFGGAMTGALPRATTVAVNSDVTPTTPALTTQESPR